jgi:hypothetical protein
MPTARLNGATRHSDNVAMTQPDSDINVSTSDTPSDITTMTLRHRLRQRRDMMSQLVADNDSRIATMSLNAGLGVVIVVNFVLSFAGIYDYARYTMGYNHILAPLAPIGIDGLTLCAIASVYRMRNAHWRIRAFTWAVYLVPTLVSVAMNAGHASQRHSDNVAIAAAATWPVLLSLAIHLSVVVSRHSERAKHVAKTKRQRQATATATATQSDVAPTNVATPSTSKTPKMSQPKQRQATSDSDKTFVRQRVANGDTISDILSDMSLAGDKTTRKRFERWTQDLRTIP